MGLLPLDYVGLGLPWAVGLALLPIFFFFIDFISNFFFGFFFFFGGLKVEQINFFFIRGCS